jgi:hypothetical protein
MNRLLARFSYLFGMAAPVQPRTGYVGTIGQREVFTLQLVAKRQDRMAGSTVYEFRDTSGSAIAWFSNHLPLEIGETYHVRATVHRHLRYQGVPTTYVTRVTVLSSFARAPFAATPVRLNARATYQRIAAGTTNSALRNRLGLTTTPLPVPSTGSSAT